MKRGVSQHVSTWLIVPICSYCAAGPLAAEARKPTSVPATAPVNRLGILSPPDGCSLKSPALQIIAVTDRPGPAAKLTLDGKPLDTRAMRLVRLQGSSSRPASGGLSAAATEASAGTRQIAHRVLVAAAEFTPGRHALEIGGRRVRVSVPGPGDADSGQPDWPAFRAHPPADESGKAPACRTCHDVTESASGPTLGGAREPECCFSCHPREEVEGLHPPHRIDVLSACRMCHAPHGATRPSLLKDEAKVLCTKCHEQ
jgi:predicted CXXCH cytochrome family protein